MARSIAEDAMFQSSCMENKLERLAVAAVAMATGPSKSAKHPSAVTGRGEGAGTQG